MNKLSFIGASVNKIVLIDDEELITSMIQNFLNISLPECDVVTFSDSTKALSFLLENKVSLIVTDVNMPVLTGMEVVKTLRENNIETPAFILSGNLKSEYHQESSSWGDVLLLSKPIKLKSFLDLIKEKILPKVS